MDFHSLQKRDIKHAPTHIHRQKRKLTILILMIIMMIILLIIRKHKIIKQQ